MATYNGKNYTTFSNVNLRGGSLRTESEDGYVLTLPAKTGTMPISGTFSVQLPAVAATTFAYSTIVTVSGIRVEDALTVTRSDQGVSASYATTSTAKIFYSAVPANGSITLNFVNLGAATGYTEHVFSFTASR